MKLTFYGAARSVTGSMHALDVGGARVLLDCGLVQGRREEAHARNQQLPEAIVAADACILSHAHIDHSGNLPHLVSRGFGGAIFATPGTRDLCDVMLRDSAHIQARDVEFLARHGHPATAPLYDVADVEAAMKQFASKPYHEWFDVVPGIRARFLEAGHVLGSAVTEIEASEKGATRRICFTGDLGRRNVPILRDPEPLPACDVAITESTYGDRVHEGAGDTEAELAAIVREQASLNGRILIPAFSLGRTQNLVYALYRIYSRGDAPRLPIFVDSPLSTQVTRVVAKHSESFDREARGAITAQGAPFRFPEVRYVESVDESKSLNDRSGALILISASGMCESGRILHHLRHSIENPTTLILIVGFQAEHTLGRRLLEGASTVRILGDEWTVRARVRKMNAMSAHADRNDLKHYLEPILRTCGKVFVVHGEARAADSLASLLRTSGCAEVHVPARLDSFAIL